MKKKSSKKVKKINKKKIYVDGIDVSYYENTDFGEYMRKNPDKVKVFIPKRITMNISSDMYDCAKILGHRFGIGYQNVLKIAMSIGLAHLQNNIKIKNK
ncbi:hypothetical protein ACFL56_02105 [Candidatus Margulisiibacteriota bacterium]